MNKRNLIIILALLIFTALCAVIYLSGRTKIPEGNLAVADGDRVVMTDPFRAPSVEVKGTTVNGRGETKEIDTTGVTLLSVLKQAGITEDSIHAVKVTSSDGFSAELSAADVEAEGIAYLIEDNGDDGETSIRLIVFGDTDSKRQVKDVVRIELIGAPPVY